jgi:hypothetical protein
MPRIFPTKPEVKAGKAATKQVSALIELPLYDVLDEHRWSIRAERFSDVVKVALQEYAVNHKLVETPAKAAAPAK